MRGLRNGSIRSPSGIDRACECDRWCSVLDKTNQSWVVAAYFNIVSDGLVVVLFMVIELCSLGIRRKVVGRGMVGLCLVCVRVRGGMMMLYTVCCQDGTP